MSGLPSISNLLHDARPIYYPVPTQGPVEFDTFIGQEAAMPSVAASPVSLTSPRLLPRLSGNTSRDVESLQPVRHRVGMSSSIAYIGCLGGALLGATGATAVAVNAYLNLKSTNPVGPFNPHGGNHQQQADALLASTASLLIPIAGGIAGAAIGGIGAMILGCCCY